MKRLDLPTLAHRDLRNRSAEVLRRVHAGEAFHVTNHGEVVAVLTPIGVAPCPRVRPAAVRGGFAALPRASADVPTGTPLDELRGER